MNNINTAKRNIEISKWMRGARSLGIEVKTTHKQANGKTQNRIQYRGKLWTFGAFHKAFVAR